MGSWLRLTSSAAAMMPKSENAAMLRTRVEGIFMTVESRIYTPASTSTIHVTGSRAISSPKAVAMHLPPWKWLNGAMAWPSTGAASTAQNNRWFGPSRCSAQNTGRKPLAMSSSRHTKPQNGPQCRNTLPEPGLPSSLTASMSMCRTRRGMISLNITLPSRNPAPIAASQ